MRINDNNTVLESAGCNVQNNEEYQINQVLYQVNRTYDILLLLKLRNSSMEEMTK